MNTLFSFYKDKTVLVTGHTGFKGSWMCQLLLMAGAKVIGFSADVPTKPSLFEIIKLDERMISVTGDIRDLKLLKNAFEKYQPEIVIHMAAQPIVREGYRNPVDTFDINIMGTVNVLECIRQFTFVKSFVNVTTDKVYQNEEWVWGYRETDRLDGFDPYSNSKSCSELVTASYTRSFFQNREVAISTMRAGNVIGGGDFAVDRIIPDCVRAAMENRPIEVRNPFSIRPYQHVLEPIVAYLTLAMKQYEEPRVFAGNYNIGPDENNCLTTGEIVTLFCAEWNRQMGNGIEWIDKYDGGPHEASILKLDCSKIKKTLRWRACWDMEQSIRKIVEWTKAYYTTDDCCAVMEQQILEFVNQVEM